MKNDKGIIYPLVITLCFIMLLFLGYLTENVLSEREFVFRQEEQLIQVRLVIQALEKSIELANDSHSFPVEHQYTWQEGNVDVAIYQTKEDERLFLIEAVTDRRNTKKLKVYYKISDNSVIKWVEG